MKLNKQTDSEVQSQNPPSSYFYCCISNKNGIAIPTTGWLTSLQRLYLAVWMLTEKKPLKVCSSRVTSPVGSSSQGDPRTVWSESVYRWCNIEYGQYALLAIALCPWLRLGIFYFKVGGMSKAIISPHWLLYTWERNWTVKPSPHLNHWEQKHCKDDLF